MLAVDAGNSSTGLGLIDCDNLCLLKRMDMPTQEIERNLAKNLHILSEGYDRKHMPVGISSVAATSTEDFRMLLKDTVPPDALRFVSADGKLPFSINYAQSSPPGSDRIADCIYAARFYPGKTSIIVDVGTAVNIELLRYGTSYEGGCIFPGLSLMLDSLHTKSAKLPSLSTPSRAELPGKSTRVCMEAGVLHGTAGAIDGIVETIRSKCDEPVAIIACGGFWPLIAPLVSTSVIYVPDCTLLGVSLFDP